MNKFSTNSYNEWVVENWTNGSGFAPYEDIAIHIRITKRGGLMAVPKLKPFEVRLTKKTKDGKPVVLSKSFKVELSEVHREGVYPMEKRQDQLLSVPGNGYEGVVSFKITDLLSDSDDRIKTSVGRWTVVINTALPDGTQVNIGPIPIIVTIYPEVSPD